jgi:hypothetical protein
LLGAILGDEELAAVGKKCGEADGRFGGRQSCDADISRQGCSNVPCEHKREETKTFTKESNQIGNWSHVNASAFNF